MKPGYEYKTPEHRRKYYNDRYHKLRGLGLCPACGKEHVPPGALFCPDCLKRRHEVDRRLRDYRIANHMCMRCGDLMSPLETHKTCFGCRMKMCGYAEKRKARNV